MGLELSGLHSVQESNCIDVKVRGQYMATKKKAPATPSVGIVLAPEPRFVTRAEAVRLVEEADRAAAAKRPSGPMYTYVGICLDRSGSMESCKSATISGFNEQIQKLWSMCNASAGEQVITTLVT